MMRRIGRIGLAAVSVAWSAACQNDTPLGPGDPLSAGEAASISNQVIALAFGAFDFGDVGGSASFVPNPAANAAGAPVDIDYSASVSASCPVSGTAGISVAVAGTIDDQTGAGNLTLDISSSMSDCAVQTDGLTFTLNTNPDLVLAGSFQFADGALASQSVFTFDGGFDWSASDGRAGSCVYDVTVTMETDGAFVESGTVCGVSIAA